LARSRRLISHPPLICPEHRDNRVLTFEADDRGVRQKQAKRRFDVRAKIDKGWQWFWSAGSAAKAWTLGGIALAVAAATLTATTTIADAVARAYGPGA